MAKPPAQRPGASKQDVETPPEFIEAVEARFGALAIDLACTYENKKAPVAFTADVDTFTRDWVSAISPSPNTGFNAWLNPEFGDIRRYAKRCSEVGKQLQSGRILMLTPASVCANWFTDYIFDQALVLLLQPRLKFVGHTHPYPKDLVLSVFGSNLRGIQPWKWESSLSFQTLQALHPKKGKKNVHITSTSLAGGSGVAADGVQRAVDEGPLGTPDGA